MPTSLEREFCYHYASKVIKGKVIACPAHVQLCEQFMGIWERVNDPKDHLWWAADKADRFERFTRERLTIKVSGKRNRQPFEFIDWQRFGARWWSALRVGEGDPDDRIPGTRATRKITLLSGKGSGKTTWAAPFVLWMLLEERDAQVWALAPVERQARRVYEEIEYMANESGWVGSVFKLRAGKAASDHARIDVDISGYKSYFRTIGEQAGKHTVHGMIPNMILEDEQWASRSGEVSHALDAGTKNRDQPLTMICTNAGTYRSEAARGEYLHSKRALCGEIPWSDQVIPMIFELPEGKLEEALERSARSGSYTKAAKRLWMLANPSLNRGGVRNDYIIKELNGAGNLDGTVDTAALQEVKREVFAYWLTSLDDGALWISPDDFAKLQVKGPPAGVDLRECPLYLGVDLGETRDFSAIAKVWVLPDGRLYAVVTHYTPAGTLRERGERAGSVELFTNMALGSTSDGEQVRKEIITCEGTTMDWDMIAGALQEAAGEGKLQCIAYDKFKMYLVEECLRKRGVEFRWTDTMDDVKDEPGFVLVEHPQKGKFFNDCNKHTMGRSLMRLTQRMEWDNPRILVLEDRFLKWQTTCTTIRQVADNEERSYLSVVKSKSSKSFNDGWVALVMATGAADWTKTYLGEAEMDPREFLQRYYGGGGAVQ